MKSNNKNNTKKIGGNKLMKGNFKKVILFIALFVVVAGGIAGLVINYQNKQYAFWKTNELRITTEFNVINDAEKAATVLDQETKDEQEASAKVTKKVMSFKPGIAKFFKAKYDSDVSGKLDKLKKVYIFSSDKYKGQNLYGYIDNESDTIHLNKDILSSQLLLQSIFTHETMHYLGIRPAKNSKNEGEYFIEGMADALADDCMSYQKKKFHNSDYYAVAMNLCKQVNIVNPEIVKNAVTKDDYNIMSDFDVRLKNVKQSCRKISGISENLENCVRTMNQDVSEMDVFFLALQAQDIITSYLKTFNPEKEQIEKIRKFYVVENYEDIVLKKAANGEYYVA